VFDGQLGCFVSPALSGLGRSFGGLQRRS